MLDDGWPHCSCGESFRGKPYWEWEKHAFDALRAQLEKLTLDLAAVDQVASKHALENVRLEQELETLRMDYRGANEQVRQLLERNELLKRLHGDYLVRQSAAMAIIDSRSNEDGPRRTLGQISAVATMLRHIVENESGEGAYNDQWYRQKAAKIIGEVRFDAVEDPVAPRTLGEALTDICDAHEVFTNDGLDLRSAEDFVNLLVAEATKWLVETPDTVPGCRRCGSETPNPACPDCCPENDKHPAAQVLLRSDLGYCGSTHHEANGRQAAHPQTPGCRGWAVVPAWLRDDGSTS